MEQHKIVIRFANGRVLKGFTSDFLPSKDLFHLTLASAHELKPVDVWVSELKAVFFVKDFLGNPARVDKKEFDSKRPIIGRKIQVVFHDGEVLVGTTQGYQPDRLGFFVIPADPEVNNIRCFVVSSAVKEVTFV